MQTRSQTRKPIFEVNIDFDEASRYWNANKKKIGNGCYIYVCGEPLKNGNFCKRHLPPNNTTCSMHHHETNEK